MSDAMGLSWGSQYNRIRRDPVLSKGIFIMKIPSGRGLQDAVCLRLTLVNGWLFKIDSTRVKPELRERIQLYQSECYDVLAKHFVGDERLIQQQNDTDSISLRLVTEARHIYGTPAAAQLWEMRGLPIVPEMRNVMRQLSLFEHASKAA